MGNTGQHTSLFFPYGKISWESWVHHLVECRFCGSAQAATQPTLHAEIFHSGSDCLNLTVLSRTTDKTSCGIVDTLIWTKDNARSSCDYPISLLHMFDGNITLKQNETTIELTSGETLLLNKCYAYRIFEPDGYIKIAEIGLSENLLKDLINDPDNEPSRLLATKSEWSCLLSTILKKISKEAMERMPVAKAAFAEMLCFILKLCLAEQTLERNHTSLFHSIRHLIHDLHTNPALSPQIIAHALGLSTQVLYKTIHLSNSDFYQELYTARIKHAIKLLENRHLAGKNISEIAYHVGFSNLSHFSSIFKKRTGLSPRLFRITKKGRKT